MKKNLFIFLGLALPLSIHPMKQDTTQNKLSVISKRLHGDEFQQARKQALQLPAQETSHNNLLESNASAEMLEDNQHNNNNNESPPLKRCLSMRADFIRHIAKQLDNDGQPIISLESLHQALPTDHSISDQQNTSFIKEEKIKKEFRENINNVDTWERAAALPSDVKDKWLLPAIKQILNEKIKGLKKEDTTLFYKYFQNSHHSAFQDKTLKDLEETEKQIAQLEGYLCVMSFDHDLCEIIKAETPLLTVLQIVSDYYLDTMKGIAKSSSPVDYFKRTKQKCLGLYNLSEEAQQDLSPYQEMKLWAQMQALIDEDAKEALIKKYVELEHNSLKETMDKHWESLNTTK